MNQSTNLKNRISEYAQGLGFDLVGFSMVALPMQPQQIFVDWINKKRHGSMDYLARRLVENRQNQAVLPDAKTVISLGTNYFQGSLTEQKPNPLEPKSQQADDENGRVARYAITRDYHKIITAKLKKLSRYLEENFHCQTKFYVDTGPILERAYATEGGLGYIGNNSCLISEQFGSWIFLSEIITDLTLDPDQKKAKISCGSCRRCIDLCPTRAINEDKTIDARKCISYLTIENKGAIPLEFREKVGNWLYGCDICQDVCPHNAKAKPTKVEEFKEIRIKNYRLNLAEILQIKNDEEFLQIFAGTPLMRAKRRGLLRNACVVAGNSGNKNLIPNLQKILVDEEDEMLQEHAQWAIEKIRQRPYDKSK